MEDSYLLDKLSITQTSVKQNCEKKENKRKSRGEGMDGGISITHCYGLNHVVPKHVICWSPNS